ncbi:MAG: sugar-binding protein [Sedimentisphaeraceae bacterium JB056]
MNKTIYIILITLTATLGFARVNYNIPYVEVLPTYDGVLQAGEWDDALSIAISYEDLVTNGSGADVLGSTPASSDISGTYYFKWDEDFLYMAFDVTDDIQVWRNSYPGSYNGQDDVQVCFNPFDDPAAVFMTDAWIFDFAAETSDLYGPDVYRHTGDIFVDPNMIASTLETDGYVIEVALSWKDISSEITAKAGDYHGFGLMIVDVDSSTAESLLCDFGEGVNVISNPAQWNILHLVDSKGCGSVGRLSADINADCYVDLSDFVMMTSDWMESSF